MNNTKRISLALIIGFILSAFSFYVQPIQYAEALSVTTFDNNGDEANGITKCGSKVITTDSTTLDIHFYSASNPSTHLGELTTGGGFAMGCDTTGTRAFTYTSSGVLQEIDVPNQALLRSLSTGCDTSVMFVNIGASSTLVCGTATATDTVKIVNLASMAITYTSTTLDTGVNNCDNIIGLWYYSTTDTLFATCTGNDRLVAVIGFSVSGTPDFSLTSSGSSPTAIAFNNVNSNIFVCDAGATSAIYDFSPSTGITLSTSFSNGQCGSPNAVDFDAGNGWYIVFDGDGQLIFYDAQDEAVILPVGLGSVGGSNQFQFDSTVATWVALASNTDFAKVDATGIEQGGGGTGEGPVGETECEIDFNFDGDADLILPDIGGPEGAPDQNGEGGVPDGMCDSGVIQFATGRNITETGNSFGCMLGFLECDEFGNPDNPNTATNGIGWLVTVVAFGIMIGIFFVASKGDLGSIPTFVWMLASLALLGALVAFNMIDVVFFLIAIVAIVALFATRIIQQLNLGGFR